MKNLLLTTFALLALNASFAQDKKTASSSERHMVGQVFRNASADGTKPSGSPYQQHMFAPAKVDNITPKAFMRYNVFNDEFEFITPQNDTLVLDKSDEFSVITFLATNKKYQLQQYTKNGKLVYGYLINTYEKGGFVLFIKENIDFYEGKKAKTSLEIDMPSRYAKTGDSYFLQNKAAGITEFPDGKKALSKLFPDKKAAIETFVKEHKISFDEKDDLIKVIDFLATL